MKTPVDTLKGTIVSYDEKKGGFYVFVPYDDYFIMTKREYKECWVQFLDNRPLSDKQRRACYAFLTAISDHTGYELERTKEIMKSSFLGSQVNWLGDKTFSLADANMSLICAFERYLVRFILDWDIPCYFSLLKFVDDVPDYLYSCLVAKKCCICGRPSELHHVDRVGMGRNREDILHEGLEALPLCREHHTEAHTMPDADFFKKYHLDGGIILDKELCIKYGLKTMKENEK